MKCRLVKCEEANSSVHWKQKWGRALGEGGGGGFWEKAQGNEKGGDY